MRTHQELLKEIELRKALGLPRIELTAEERARAFGDPNLVRGEDDYGKACAERYLAGLPLSIDGKRRARRFLKTQKATNVEII